MGWGADSPDAVLKPNVGDDPHTGLGDGGLVWMVRDEERREEPSREGWGSWVPEPGSRPCLYRDEVQNEFLT